jgi:hypothetical protein
MFNFRQDQNKFNNNGGQEALTAPMQPSLGNMNRQTGVSNTQGQTQTQNYAPVATSPTGNPYQQLSRDRYLNENYRNPTRQRMGRIGRRRPRQPMDLRKMQFMQSMMRNRRSYGV